MIEFQDDDSDSNPATGESLAGIFTQTRRRYMTNLALVGSSGAAIGAVAGDGTVEASDPDETVGYGEGGYGEFKYGGTDGPSVSTYTNDDDVVDTPHLRDAIDDWTVEDIGTDLLREVIDYWTTGEPVE